MPTPRAFIELLEALQRSLSSTKPNREALRTLSLPGAHLYQLLPGSSARATQAFAGAQLERYLAALDPALPGALDR